MTGTFRLLKEAFSSRVGKRVLGVLAAVLTICSVAYLVVFAWAYHFKLTEKATQHSLQVNRLISGILFAVPHQPDAPRWNAITQAFSPAGARLSLLDANGVARFQSGIAQPSTTVAYDLTQPSADMLRTAAGEHMARSILPLRNDPQCMTCHGRAAAKPVLGILVLDVPASTLAGDLMQGIFLMTLAGGTVLLAALVVISTALAKRVLLPVRQLQLATLSVGAGKQPQFQPLTGDDEVAQLAQQFNAMAGRVEDMLQASRLNEDFLQRLIDAVPDGIRVIAPDYGVLRVNSAYCKQLGISPEDAVGRTCHLSTHGIETPCSAKLVTCPLVELTGTGRNSLRCHHRHVRHDGSELFVEVSAAAAPFMRNGKVEWCVIESIRDLGEQAEASHKYRLAELGQLATGVAHEIHNPLWSIHLALAAIRDDIRQDVPLESVENYVETADQEIARCLAVTDRLLKLAEPSSEQTVIVPLAEAVDAIVRLVSFEARNAKVAVHHQIPEHLRIVANESDLSIVILNLVQNAIHAMPEGGALRISALSDGSTITLCFADSGVGIAQEDLVRIFWPFWSRRADGVQGTGLGLSIVAAIVKRLDGNISVKSKLGSGTTFTLHLPDADKHQDLP